MLLADTRATPCSQPLLSSVTHDTGTVADIPDQPYDLYVYRFTTDSAARYRASFGLVAKVT